MTMITLMRKTFTTISVLISRYSVFLLTSVKIDQKGETAACPIYSAKGHAVLHVQCAPPAVTHTMFNIKKIKIETSRLQAKFISHGEQ